MKLTSESADVSSNDRSAGVSPAVPSEDSPETKRVSRLVSDITDGPTVAGSGQVKIRDRGRLPHWEKDGTTYFITFRLADSLPKSVLDRIESEKQAIIKTANQLHRDLSPDERRKIQRLSTPVIEQFLDNGAGACHMRNPAVARETAAALTHFDERRHRLFAWCVMPNHVHVAVRFFPGQSLAAVLHSCKSFSAKQANRILGLQGAFWQRSYYDHILRNEEEFERALRYVAENPIKANLKDWEWVWVCGRDARMACPEPAEGACPEPAEGTAAEDGGATKPSGSVSIPAPPARWPRAS